MSSDGERLQKVLAAAGHGSRRAIEEWIRAGRVSVNGRIAQLGDRVSPTDDVRLDGRPLRASNEPMGNRQALLYHKPLGELTTRKDPQGRPTVFERLPAPRSGRWIAVGRLDVNTSGLLLFTTDGELAHRLMHPSSEIEREYLVRVRGHPSAEAIARLRSGVLLEDGMARFEAVSERERTRGHTWFSVVLREGRNREVRRLWEAAGFEVSRLMRVRFGSLKLPRTLRPGTYLEADESSLNELYGLLAR
jgi:23S rRNA pseudouridine2605 synthase